MVHALWQVSSTVTQQSQNDRDRETIMGTPSLARQSQLLLIKRLPETNSELVLLCAQSQQVLNNGLKVSEVADRDLDLPSRGIVELGNLLCGILFRKPSTAFSVNCVIQKRLPEHAML